MIVQLGLSPLSEEARQLHRNVPALIFTHTALDDVQREQYQRLGEMLGVYWTREGVQSMFQTQDPKRAQQAPRTTLTVPLLLGVKPELRDFLQQSFGKPLGITPPEWYQHDQGEVVEGWELSREEFIKVASMFTGLIPKTPQ